MRASIVIAAHNEGESLSKTVASIVESSVGLHYEIVVADDASDDGSVEEMLRRFPRVRVVRHQQRRGASPTKDLGARDARGEVFVFLDGHTNPQPGAILQLVDDVERVEGRAVLTPTVEALDVGRWRNTPSQVGHGYRLELERFDCGWLPLGELRQVRHKGRTFYESPALIGCALAVGRELYEDLRGFDPHMRFWGVEDLDFGLKCWLLGFSILHDPEAVVGHRFRESFDNYDVPIEHLVVNQLRMARKSFTHSVWSEWVDRCRARHPGRLSDHPEGLWARVWSLFEAERPSVEQERAYLHARRVRDEFSYAERFGLSWPRLETARPAPLEMAFEAMAAEGSPSPIPSPSPPPCKVDLVIYNGLEGYSGGQEIPKYVPGDPNYKGAVTVVNMNDTDGDGRTDRDDEIVSKALTVTTAAAGQGATTITVDDTEGYEVDDNIAISKSDDSEGEVATVQSINTGSKVITLTAALSRAYASGSKVYHAGRNEIDLMKLVLKKPVPDDGGNVTLTVVSGDIKLWESSSKGTEVGLTNGKVEYATSQLDKTLWVEARSVSASLRDIVLEMEYQDCKDTVKATGVWVTKTARSPWHTRQAADGFPDNPEPGQVKTCPI